MRWLPQTGPWILDTDLRRRILSAASRRNHLMDIMDRTFGKRMIPSCGQVGRGWSMPGARRASWLMICAVVLGLVIGPASFAQEEDQEDLARRQLEYTRANYTKYDYRIPMRDGVKLFTTVYAPKDAGRTYPILMQRTPYSISPYGIDNYQDRARSLRGIRKRGLHLRLSGRARAIFVRGGIRRYALS